MLDSDVTRGVSESKRQRAGIIAKEQLNMDDSGFVSYGHFNKFTLEMLPWIPARGVR